MNDRDVPDHVRNLYSHAETLAEEAQKTLAHADSVAARRDTLKAEHSRVEDAYNDDPSDDRWNLVREARDVFERAALDARAAASRAKRAEKAHNDALTAAESAEVSWLHQRTSESGWSEELETAGLGEFLQCQRRSIELLGQLHDATRLTQARGKRLEDLTGRAALAPDRDQLLLRLRRLVGAVWDRVDNGWRSGSVLSFYLREGASALQPSHAWDPDSSQRADAQRLLAGEKK